MLLDAAPAGAVETDGGGGDELRLAKNPMVFVPVKPFQPSILRERSNVRSITYRSNVRSITYRSKVRCITKVGANLKLG